MLVGQSRRLSGKVILSGTYDLTGLEVSSPDLTITAAKHAKVLLRGKRFEVRGYLRWLRGYQTNVYI